MSLGLRKFAWIATMALVVAANLFNLGILRIWFGFVLLPYFLVVARVNWKFLNLPDFGVAHAILFVAALLIYAGANLVLPDCGSIEPYYVFFRRYEFTGDAGNSWWIWTLVLFIASALLTVWEFSELRLEKAHRKKMWAQAKQRKSFGG
ncbi:MAG: hypothetical protein RL173_1393 [Fibrobacterota bacterium]|jgi:hypothetical protein